MPIIAPRTPPVDLPKMRAACALAAETLAYAAGLVAPGITTGEVDRKTDRFIRKRGAVPAPYKYGKTPYRMAFPKSTCTSVNEVVCHGIPGKQKLVAGDLVAIDISVILDEHYGDNCVTVPVGEVDQASRELMRVTLESLRRGIDAARNGARLLEIGDAIQTYAEGLGYGVVEDFLGHGIGRKFHQDPQVSHVAKPRGSRERLPNPTIRAGQIFTVEPMINAGTYQTVTLDDGWTAITADHKRSAQYEHTLLITPDGPPQILTLLPNSASTAPAGYEP